MITTAKRPGDIIDIIGGDTNKGTLFRPFQHPIKENKRFISVCGVRGRLSSVRAVSLCPMSTPQ